MEALSIEPAYSGARHVLSRVLGLVNTGFELRPLHGPEICQERGMCGFRAWGLQSYGMGFVLEG
jgi:hypothetical protein